MNGHETNFDGVDLSTKNAMNNAAQLFYEIAKTKGFLNVEETCPRWLLFFATHISLMHSELSEALEAARTDFEQKSEKIPEFTLIEEELADVVIRVLMIAGRYNLDVGGAIVAKGHYNKGRPHMHGGQAF
jgi:NTP pyrophosphatase (non-canonical NTP hydrolase)